MELRALSELWLEVTQESTRSFVVVIFKSGEGLKKQKQYYNS